MTKKKPRRILAQPYDYSVQDIVDKIKTGDIDLNPNYQRNYVWDSNDDEQNKCSRLIESLLLNIPIPVIYFAEQAETLKYEVIDGQQRLETFRRFLNDEFPLKNLEIRDDVNGKVFKELDQTDRDEIRKRSIRAIVILNESDEEVKYEVFERLNLGSIQLTPQEIRNNTLRGTFNEMLKRMADLPRFKGMVKLRLKSDKENMAREELVLRFFAYHDSGAKRVKNLSYFLTEYMKNNQNPSPERINELESLFEKTIELVYKYLGDNSFANYSDKTLGWTGRTNRSLYDAEMLAFSAFTDRKIRKEAKAMMRDMIELFQDADFKKGINAQSVGRMMEKRVSAIRSVISAQG